MPRSKKATREIEQLEEEIKNLKSINRQLKKRLRDLEKREYIYDDFLKNVVPEDSYKKLKKRDICPECGKGSLTISDLTFVKYIVCNVCQYKKKV